MNDVIKLNLNKHPKDNLNLSLVNALNVKISHDESCITNEESVFENTFIRNYFNDYYGGESLYKIVGIIPCSNELVIVVKDENGIDVADIFRYREPINGNIESINIAYGGKTSNKRFKYSGGNINGTFTYNVEDSLIVAIAEFSETVKNIPLRTINLGNFDFPNIHNDKDLSDGLLSITPEVVLPEVKDLDYVAGNAYKGWYYIFLRYKINTVDYTQWYSIGTPIYVDTIEKFQIIRYAFNRDPKFNQDFFPIGSITNIIAPDTPKDGFGVGATDYFSDTTDIAKETFKVNIIFDEAMPYTKYQIGVMACSKSYTKAFRTSDINVTDTSDIATAGKTVQEYKFDIKSVVEYGASEFIVDNFNYFDVEQVINYKNRLYFRNYSEQNSNNNKVDLSKIDAIEASPVLEQIRDYGLVYDTAIMSNVNAFANQYDTYNITLIPMDVYLGVPKDTLIVVNDGTTGYNDIAGAFYITSGNSTPNWAYVEYRRIVGGMLVKTDIGKDSSVNINISILNKDGIISSTTTFNTRQSVLNGGVKYLNTNVNFNDRKKNSTLIPGEVYNFFIHYVDKYGHATNGYRISNNTKWTTEDSPNMEITPVSFRVKQSTYDVTIYAALSLNSNILLDNGNGEYDININGIKYYYYYNNDPINPKLTNLVTDINDISEYNTYFKEYFSSYREAKFLRYKWYQVATSPGFHAFHLYINNNGDRLFKVPLVASYTEGMDGFPGNIEEVKFYRKHTLFKAKFDNIEIPEDYIGYFISYEKHEEIRRVTGLLTRSDFRSQDWITRNGVHANLHTANDNKSNNMFFYSSHFDIADTIKLDYNIIRVEGVNVFYKQDIKEWDYLQRNGGFGFVNDMNKPQEDNDNNSDQHKTYSIPEYKIVVGDSAIDNRMGLGTALQIKDAYNLFPNYDPTAEDNNKIKLYRVSLLNATRNLYMSDDKTLFRLTDVKYRDKNNPIDYKYSTGIVKDGYNGHYTFDGVLVYENATFAFNTSTNKVTSIMGNDEYYKTSVTAENYHTFQNDVPFVSYVQFPVCTDIFFESKSYKNPPNGILYVVKTEGEKNMFSRGVMVTPANSVDLFENRQGSQDDFNTKFYSNYRKDLVAVERYDKTIRRSAVIQDESRTNGWRTFPVEAYKNITENKGKLTNLVGLGTVLIAHTEHSMFVFDTDNMLRTEGRDIQLSQPDAFEVQYKEVFTSDLGFGGLQDSKSYSVDEFGYIFYSNDTNRVYRFDNGRLEMVDDDIQHWLYKYKPYNVRFANDKRNNRLIIKFEYFINGVIKDALISYNYKTNTFVSLHSYYFNEAYNTKTGLYLHCDNDHNGCSLHEFDYSGNSFCSFDNVKGSIGTSIDFTSKLSFIINQDFKTSKYLEFFTYKLTKYVNDVDIDFTNSPVEEYIVPFSGDTIKVYNNETNTGVLDVAVDAESSKNVFAQFDKPYWDKGVWNFSYLRNNLSERSNGVPASEMSRIFGNYFVVEFVFNNEDNRKIEFEELSYNISKL